MRGSSAVKTSRTPGLASAADTSMGPKFAEAYGERTTNRRHVPGGAISDVYCPCPRTSRASSVRGSDLPMNRYAMQAYQATLDRRVAPTELRYSRQRSTGS